MARFPERLRRWFTPWHDKSTCPVCGLAIEITNPIRTALGGSWSIPMTRRELVGYCTEQNDTSHDVHAQLA